MRNSIVSKLLVEYQKKIDQKKETIKNRKKDLYRKIPRLKEIDHQIQMHSLKTNKLIIKNPDNIEEQIDKLKTIIEDLKKEKAYVLTENNIPLDKLQLKYDCNKCKDTGFISSGKKCKCLKQKIINEYYKMSNLTHKLKTENFNNFDISIFSDNINKDYNKSQKDNIKEILSIAESFSFNFKIFGGKNLLFYGPPGQGKTYLCNCIASTLINKGYLVLYQTAFKLVEIIEEARFSKNSFSSNNNSYQMLFNADLLIIDDLGTEFINSFTNVEIFNIINTRLNQNRNTIISTNLFPGELKEKYSERISSRLFGHYTLLPFFGPDLRWE